ncbi:MAG: transglycosylase domain-containing protein, partial [Nitrospirae bacterium]|nr:transglycosylase domain-containing protein [Nitrospirota bacterium]
SLFLSPERSLKRKMTEVLLARRMEKALSKEEILETYLNQIYFGHGAYGVQSAARTYFGKDVGELTLAESALLAGLPRSPNEYSPINHPDRAKQRQETVLKRMLAEKFIDADRYKKAVSEDIRLRQLHEKDENPSYFLEYLRLYLIGVYGDDMVYKGGLNIYTTLSLDMQQLAAKTFKK